jgi:hypothetical protein
MFSYLTSCAGTDAVNVNNKHVKKVRTLPFTSIVRCACSYPCSEAVLSSGDGHIFLPYFIGHVMLLL